METVCACFEIGIVVVDKLPLAVILGLDTMMRYAEGIYVNVRSIRWRLLQRLRQRVTGENLKFPNLTNEHIGRL